METMLCFAIFMMMISFCTVWLPAEENPGALMNEYRFPQECALKDCLFTMNWTIEADFVVVRVTAEIDVHQWVAFAPMSSLDLFGLSLAVIAVVPDAKNQTRSTNETVLLVTGATIQADGAGYERNLSTEIWNAGIPIYDNKTRKATVEFQQRYALRCTIAWMIMPTARSNMVCSDPDPEISTRIFRPQRHGKGFTMIVLSPHDESCPEHSCRGEIIEGDAEPYQFNSTDGEYSFSGDDEGNETYEDYY